MLQCMKLISNILLCFNAHLCVTFEFTIGMAKHMHVLGPPVPLMHELSVVTHMSYCLDAELRKGVGGEWKDVIKKK